MGTWLQVTEDQDPRRQDKSHGWLKEPRVRNRRKQAFTGLCERLSKYHPDLCVVIKLWVRGAVSVAQDEQEKRGEERGD